MKRLARPALSAAAQAFLQKRSAAVAAAADQKATVNHLWGLKQNKTFDEIREKLCEMTAGDGEQAHCGYCEHNEATDIEHFYPKAQYPARAFDWDNYLWACSNCNSNHKRNRFPLDSTGAPLLIDPSSEEPSEHLAFSPMTGKLAPLNGSPKGAESIDVFGLNRGFLERSRRHAWLNLLALLVQYSRRRPLAWDARIQDAICSSQHASLLRVVIDLADREPAPPLVALDPVLRDAVGVIHEHPEIRGWL